MAVCDEWTWGWGWACALLRCRMFLVLGCGLIDGMRRYMHETMIPYARPGFTRARPLMHEQAGRCSPLADCRVRGGQSMSRMGTCDVVHPRLLCAPYCPPTLLSSKCLLRAPTYLPTLTLSPIPTDFTV